MTHVRVPSAAIRTPSPGPGPLAIVGRAIEAHGEKLAQQSENLQVAKFGADLLELDDQAREAAGKAEPQAAEGIYSSQLDAFEKTLGTLSPDARARAAPLLEQRRALGQIAVKRDARQRTTDLHIAQANRRITSLMERVASGSVADQQISMAEIDETLDSLVEEGAITRPERFNKQTEVQQEIRQRQKDEAFVALDTLLTDASANFAAVGSDEQRSSIQSGFDKIVDAARAKGDINTKQAARFKSEFRSTSGRRLAAKGASLNRRLSAEFQADNAQHIELLKEEIAELPKGQMRSDLEVEANTLLQRLDGTNGEVSILFGVLDGTVEAALPQRATTLNKAYQSIKGRGEDPITFITQLLENDSALPPDYVKDLKTLAKPESLDLMSLRNNLVAIRGIDGDEAERIARATGVLGQTAYQVTKSLEDTAEIERRVKILSDDRASLSMSEADAVIAGGDARDKLEGEKDPLDIKSVISKHSGIKHMILSGDQTKAFNASFRFRFAEQRILFQQEDSGVSSRNAQKVAAEELSATHVPITVRGTGRYVVEEGIFNVGTIDKENPGLEKLQDSIESVSRFLKPRIFAPVAADIRPDLAFRRDGKAYIPILNNAGPVTFLEWDLRTEKMTQITPSSNNAFFNQLRADTLDSRPQEEMVSNAHLRRQDIHGDTPLGDVPSSISISDGINDEALKQWIGENGELPRTAEQQKAFRVLLGSLAESYGW